MTRKVTYIVSDTAKALQFEWVAERLNKNRFELNFILIGARNTPLMQALKKMNIAVTEFDMPKKWQLPWLTFKIVRLLKRNNPDVVHTHMPTANLVGLTAAKICAVPIRIFTRHHAMVHHDEHKKGLLFDAWHARMATHIIGISKSVIKIMTDREGVDPSKIKLIHHGFDLEYFNQVSHDRINEIKSRYGLNDHHPIIGVVARYLKLKGIQYIIPAFAQLLKQFPNAKLILANAYGPYQEEIKKLLCMLPTNAYVEIPFEADLAALYQTMNVYVHAPVAPEQESFGQTYVEALAAGIPSVFTLAGVAPELIKHDVNVLVVPYCDADAIHQSIVKLLQDESLRTRLVNEGKKSVTPFSIDRMIASLTELYGS